MNNAPRRESGIDVSECKGGVATEHPRGNRRLESQREDGYASIRFSWWRNQIDRRFWSVHPLCSSEDCDVLLGVLGFIRCVTDDFGNLVRVS